MRGIVEGFYGEPWSHEARLQVLALAARHGFETFVYAPKDEPKHRTRWRELYDGEEAARFRELGQAAAAAGIRLVYSVHPGGEPLPALVGGLLRAEPARVGCG